MVVPPVLLQSAFARDPKTVDRVVASIGNLAITESDVVREYRFEAFVSDGRVPAQPPPANLFDKLESRLIDQMLLEQQLRDYPADPNSVLERAMEEQNTIRTKFRSGARYHDALRSLGLTEEQLLHRLETQQHILMMIDERTRPAAAVEPQDIQDYYRKTLLPQLIETTREKPPPLAQVQDKIREILVQQKMNQLLGEWLAELKTEQHVRVFGS